jgi:hypothetical protein
MTVTVDERGYTTSQDQVAADGQRAHAAVLMKPDGKEYPADGVTATIVAIGARNHRVRPQVIRPRMVGAVCAAPTANWRATWMSIDAPAWS